MAALSPEGHDTTTCLLSLHQLPTQWLDQHHQHLLVILPDHDVADSDDSNLMLVIITDPFLSALS